MTSANQSMVAGQTQGAPLKLGVMMRLAIAALCARYRTEKPAGRLFLIGAVLDPFVYAGVIYFVIAGVFERTGFDRYFFLLIGLISFRWTVTCILDSANFTELRARMREASRHPTILALLIVVAAPTAVMLMSVAVTLALTSFLQPSGWSARAIPWLILVIAVHGVWNLIAVLAVHRLKAHRSFTSERVVMVVAGLMWLLSPTLYRFGDIPDAASLIFTTLNPVSHVLAGYYNALWYGTPVSADVLPLAGVLGLFLLIVLRRRLDLPRAESRTVKLPLVVGQPLLVVMETDPDRRVATSFELGDVTRFRRWYGRLRGLTARDLIRLIAIARDEPDIQDVPERSRATSGANRLFDEQIALCPDRTLAQIAFAAALESRDRALLFDGVLDAADRVFANRAWARLARAAQDGRRIIVVTYNLLPVPEAVDGTFIAIKDGRCVRSGRFGADLSVFYDEVLRTGAFPSDGPD